MRGQKPTAKMAAALHPESGEGELEKHGGRSLEGLRTDSPNRSYISLIKITAAPAEPVGVGGREIWHAAKQKEKEVE